MNNRENIYLFDTLFYHFLNKKDYLEAIEVLADIYSIDNSGIISKSMSLYDACNDKKLIFDILDDHYTYYKNINFIRIKFSDVISLRSMYIINNNNPFGITYICDRNQIIPFSRIIRC